MLTYSCIQTHCIYTPYTAYCIIVLYKIQENTIQVQKCIKDLQGRMENKAMCVCSHMLFCASLSGSGVGGGLHQWVCSPAGQTWVDMSGWSEGSEYKGEVCVRCERVGGVGWGPQESAHPISHVELGGIDRKATALFPLPPMMLQLTYHT